jgi:hypothetical protein
MDSTAITTTTITTAVTSSGRSRFKWENNIKMDLTEIGCADVYYTHLTQNMAPVNMAMNWIPYIWVVPNPLSGNELHKMVFRLQVISWKLGANAIVSFS